MFIFIIIIYKDWELGSDLSLADFINGTLIVIFFPISILVYIIVYCAELIYDFFGDDIILKGKDNYED